MDGLSELAAAARARNEAYRAEKDKGIIAKAVEPLKQRIVELEGLLANAVENGDRLAEELAKSEAALAESKAHVESLQSQLKVFESQTAKAVQTAKAAKKKGK